jgi:hypothetical protein
LTLKAEEWALMRRRREGWQVEEWDWRVKADLVLVRLEGGD